MTIRRVPKDRRIQLHQSALNRAGRALSSTRLSSRLYSALMRMIRLSNLRLLSQERRQLLQRRHRRLEHVVELRKLHDRLKHTVRVNHQSQQGANLHGAAQHRITTQHQRTGNKHIA